MKEKEKCKIVQDLLPSFIEHLTNDETNKFIEEHIETCEDCKKVYENMKKDLNVDNNTKEKKKVKFLKKYRNKLRVLEIIILIIFVAFVINTGRKIYIITDLNNKAEEYTSSTNYHRVIYTIDKGNYRKTEIFSLDDKKKIVSTTMSSDGKKKVVRMYGTKIGTDTDTQYVKTNTPIENYRQNIYVETETERTARLNLEASISVDPQEAFWGLDNIGQLIVCAITTSINKTTFDGEECYYVSAMPYILSNTSMYVNKDTGLLISAMASEVEVVDGSIQRIPGAEYEFEFGTVTEDDFIEPDISEYKIIGEK